MKNKISRPIALLISISMLTVSTSSIAAKNPNDPYESYNRFMYGFNDKIDRFALKPVAKGYRKVTPGPVRKSVNNFFNNFRDVYSIASNLLRADFKKAANDTMRVAINTTWGIGGLFDIATEANLDINQNTLGDTFASWGWKNSNYFVYPILGPSTVRDGLSSTITVALPGTYGIAFHGKYDPWGAKAVDALSVREQALNLTDSLEIAALDPYAYTRDIYMSYRKQAIYGKNDETPEDDFDFDDESDVSTSFSSPNENNQQTSIVEPITESDAQEQSEIKDLNNAYNKDPVISLNETMADENLDFIAQLTNEELSSSDY